jgi:tRNA dimethylallyltransferase
MTGPILISGPTASGKSALALALAARVGGAVINADALQVYGCWRVLSARPPAEDEAAAPHLLYGHVAAEDGYSTGRWLRDLAGALATCRAARLRPIIVGGTGLYFRAATVGLAEMPEPDPALRAGLEARLAANGLTALVAALAAVDPATAARIDTDNPRRVLRAWEVLETTGLGLAAHHDATPPPMIPLTSALALRLTPDRARLYAACDARFDAMLAGGALEEAAAVAALTPPACPQAMQALGARELVAHLRGEITLAEARERATRITRNYAKRQLTWTRNQMGGWRAFDGGADALAALIAEGAV